MKKYHLILLMMTGSLLAETHQVTVFDNRFSPEVLSVQSGDSIQWVVAAGTHQIVAIENEQAIAFSSPVLTPNSQFTAVVTGTGGEVFYSSSADPNMQGALVVQSAANDFVIDERVNATYHNPTTPGQGFLFEYVPANDLLIAYWFTYNKAGDAQQWFIATGSPEGHRATLVVNEPMGGQFNDPQAITSHIWGELTIEFDSCYQATAHFNAAGEKHSGTVPIERLYLAQPCQQEATQ